MTQKYHFYTTAFYCFNYCRTTWSV